jgi:hypothetical protein
MESVRVHNDDLLWVFAVLAALADEGKITFAERARVAVALGEIERSGHK